MRPLLLWILALLPATATSQPVAQQVLHNSMPGTLGFGRAMDADGDTLVVGAPTVGENGIWRGGVSVFVKAAGSWVLQQTLTRTTGEAFGSRVAVSGDTLIAATEYLSPNLDPGPLVYVRSNGVWTEQAQLRTSHGTVRTGARVDLDGDTAVLATVDRAVYVFVRTGPTWTEQQQLVQENSPLGGSLQVALEGDTLLVGAPLETVDGVEHQGAVHVFTQSAGVWTQRAVLTVPPPTIGEFFGAAVALSGDTAIALGDEVYQFRRVAGTWTRQASLVLPTGPVVPTVIAYPITVTLDGNTAIVQITIDPRAPVDAYVFRRVGDRWVRLEPPGNRLNYVVSGDAIFGGDAAAAGGGRVIVFSVPEPLVTGPPSAPDNLRPTVSGNTLTLTWHPPQVGAAPTGYELVARTSSGGSVFATLPIGPETSITLAAPNGQFVLSVTASNAHGTSAESPGVTVYLPGALIAPRPPTNLTASVTGATITFAWNPPSGGPVPTDYVLVAGQTPSISPPLATIPVGTSTSYAAGGVPAGNYYVVVRARNGSSVGAPSNVVNVTVAGETAPGAPRLAPPQVSGSTVTLTWTPGTGGTPSSYTLVARSTFWCRHRLSAAHRYVGHVHRRAVRHLLPGAHRQQWRGYQSEVWRGDVSRALTVVSVAIARPDDVERLRLVVAGLELLRGRAWPAA